MKVFVTGGTGFLGGHFIRQAISLGWDIIALRRSVGSVPVVQLPRQPTWLLSTLQELDPCLLRGCDAVVHFSAAGVPPKSVDLATLSQVNIVDSVLLAEKALQAGVPRLVVAGTCHEYGLSAANYEFIPVDAPLLPVGMYGASKAASFILLSTYSKVHPIELFYGRVFSAYGIGQNSQNLWPSLRECALSHKDFYMTTGSQIRDFIAVEQVADKFIQACLRTDILLGQPVVENVASGQAKTVLSFVMEQWALFNPRSQVVPNSIVDSRPENIPRIVALIP